MSNAPNRPRHISGSSLAREPNMGEMHRALRMLALTTHDRLLRTCRCNDAEMQATCQAMSSTAFGMRCTTITSPTATMYNMHSDLLEGRMRCWPLTSAISSTGMRPAVALTNTALTLNANAATTTQATPESHSSLHELGGNQLEG